MKKFFFLSSFLLPTLLFCQVKQYTVWSKQELNDLTQTLENETLIVLHVDAHSLYEAHFHIDGGPLIDHIKETLLNHLSSPYIRHIKAAVKAKEKEEILKSELVKLICELKDKHTQAVISLSCPHSLTVSNFKESLEKELKDFNLLLTSSQDFEIIKHNSTPSLPISPTQDMIVIHGSTTDLKMIKDHLAKTNADLVIIDFKEAHKHHENATRMQWYELIEYERWINEQQALDFVKDHDYLVWTHTVDELIENIGPIQAGTLVVFDVDEVLISTSDMAFRYKYNDIFFPSLFMKIKEALTEEEKTTRMNALSLTFSLPKRDLSHPKMLTLVQELQDQGIKTIALTSYPYGKFGIVESASNLRISMLKEIGFDFSETFKDLKCLSLIEEGKNGAVFEEGIIFASKVSKGKALKAFMEKTGYLPSHVILVDDHIENHMSLNKHLKKMGIPFKGIVYKASLSTLRQVPQEHFETQLNTLIEKQEWIPDASVVFDS